MASERFWITLTIACLFSGVGLCELGSIRSLRSIVPVSVTLETSHGNKLVPGQPWTLVCNFNHEGGTTSAYRVSLQKEGEGSVYTYTQDGEGGKYADIIDARMDTATATARLTFSAFNEERDLVEWTCTIADEGEEEGGFISLTDNDITSTAATMSSTTTTSAGATTTTDHNPNDSSISIMPGLLLTLGLIFVAVLIV